MLDLSASEVITSLALLNMLIFPMNALPWVINGFMEARVSLRRIAKVLSSEDGNSLFVHNRFSRKNRHKVKFADFLFPTDSNITTQPQESGLKSVVATHESDLNQVGMRSFSTGSFGSHSLHGSAGTARGGDRSDRSRQLSGERRREELSLIIPPTIWSWATSYQIRALLEEHDNINNTNYNKEEAFATNPLQDEESQLESPLLSSHSSWSEHDITNDTKNANRKVEIASGGFAVSVNEVKLAGGQLLGIAGPTGSGKTSLLLGILGEIRGHKRADGEGGCLFLMLFYFY